jgi:hypothetical protein
MALQGFEIGRQHCQPYGTSPYEQVSRLIKDLKGSGNGYATLYLSLAWKPSAFMDFLGIPVQKFQDPL